MDAVDSKYFDEIRYALNSNSVDNLKEVCTSMSDSEAQACVEEWSRISDIIMGKIRAGIDTSNEDEQLADILYGICKRYPLSGNTIHR